MEGHRGASARGARRARSTRLNQARDYLAGALLCRYDHPATDCKIMGTEIDRRLAATGDGDPVNA